MSLEHAHQRIVFPLGLLKVKAAAAWVQRKRLEKVSVGRLLGFSPWAMNDRPSERAYLVGYLYIAHDLSLASASP
jgi:hypothetical protein